MDMGVVLAHLRPEEREALYLNTVEGYTAVEIGAMTGEPRGTVLSRLHRARERLRGWRVEGGRYCSLAGELAAQINLSDGAGRKSLLYVVPVPGELREAQSGERTYEGGTVRLWTDDGRLFAQANPASSGNGSNAGRLPCFRIRLCSYFPYG